jgi:outer membrane protein
MKIFAKLALALTLGAAALFPLQASAEIKIGTLDMRTIMANSPQAKAAMEKLKKEFKAREEHIVAVERGLKDKAEKLQRNAAVMSDTEKSKLERDIMTSQRELQRLQSEFREDAAGRQQEEMKKLVDSVNQVVEKVAKAEKFDLILHSEAAPFSSKQIDITQKVMQAMPKV